MSTVRATCCGIFNAENLLSNLAKYTGPLVRLGSEADATIDPHSAKNGR